MVNETRANEDVLPDYSYGEAYNALNELNVVNAEVILKKIVTQFPDSAQPYALLSANYFISGNDSFQQQYAKQAWRKCGYDESAFVKNIVFSMYAIAERQWQQAIDYLKSAVVSTTNPGFLLVIKWMITTQCGMLEDNNSFLRNLLAETPVLANEMIILLQIGQNYFDAGKTEEATEIANRLLKIDKPFIKVHALILLGQIEERKGRLNEAISNFKSGLSLSNSIKFNRGISMIQPKIARVYFSLHYEGIPQSAEKGMYHAKNGIAVSIKMNNSQDLAEALLVKSILDRESLIGALLNTQLKDLQLVFQIAKEQRNMRLEASAKSGLGYIYIATGSDPDSAWQYKQEVWVNLRSRNIKQWSMGNDLAWLCRQTGRLDLAEEFSSTAMSMAKENGRAHAISEASYHLGETWLAQGKLKKGQRYV